MCSESIDLKIFPKKKKRKNIEYTKFAAQAIIMKIETG